MSDETNHGVSISVRRLLACASDPMWADHAEIPKSWCTEAAQEIERLRESQWKLENNVRLLMTIADDKLIAAAPDMLEALRKAVVLLAGMCAHAPELKPHDAYEAVSAAIAKATGCSA